MCTGSVFIGEIPKKILKEVFILFQLICASVYSNYNFLLFWKSYKLIFTVIVSTIIIPCDMNNWSEWKRTFASNLL